VILKNLKNFYTFYQKEKLIDKKLKSLFSYFPTSKRYILTERCDSLSHWHLSIGLTAQMLAESLKAKVLSVFENEPLNTPKAYKIFNSSLNCQQISLKQIEKLYKEKIKNKSISIFQKIKNPSDILEIEYAGINIGPEIYDGIIKHKLCTVRNIDLKVLNEISRAIRCIECFNFILSNFNIVAGHCTHTSCSYDGVWVRLLLKRGIPVYQSYGGLNGILKINPKKNKKRYNIAMHLRPPLKLLQKHHPDFKYYLKKGKTYLNQKINGESKDWDSLKAFSKELPFIKSKSEFAKKYKISSSLPNVFIMLHAMNDDPHVKGQYLFNDYYEWFQYTLVRAAKNKQCNWIFKVHPRIKNYPDDSDLLGDIRRIRCENIKIIDEKELHSGCISHLASAVLTAGGTAALEFVAQGIPGVICTKNGYHGFSLVYEPRNLHEYEDILINKIHNLPKPSNEQKNKAIVAYYLYNSSIRNKMMNGFFEFEGNSQFMQITSDETLNQLLKNLENKYQSIKTQKPDLIRQIKKMQSTHGSRILIQSEKRNKREIFPVKS